MGTSSTGNYAPQIAASLQQANQPKSDLAKQFSGTMQGSYLPAIAGLLNGGALGNAFPGQSSPGFVFNQNQLGYVPTQGAGNVNYNQPGGVNSGNNPLPNTNPNGSSSGGNTTNPGSGTEQGQGGQLNVIPQTPNFALNSLGYNPNDPEAPHPNGLLASASASPSAQAQSQSQQAILSGSQAYANDPLGGLYARFGNGPIASTVNGNTLDNRLSTYQAAIASGYQPTPAETAAYQQAQAASAANYQYSLTHGGFGDPAYAQQIAQANNSFQGFLDYNGNVVNANNSGGGAPATNYQGPFGDSVSGIGNTYTPPNNNNTSSQQYLQSAFGQTSQNLGQQFNPSGQNAGGQFSGLINQANPQMQGMNLQQMNPQAIMQLLQSVQTPQANQNYNPSQSLLSQMGNSMNNGYTNLPNQQFSPAQLQAANPQNVTAPNAQIATGLPNAQDSEYYNSVQNILNQQLSAGRDDIRARFGASGGASRGTPAAYAEAQYNAQALPQMSAALGSVRQQEVGNQLTAQNQGNNALLSARGQDINNSQQNVQNLLQSVGLNNNSNLLQSQQLLSLLGLNSSNSLQNQGQANQFQLGQMGNAASLAGQAGQLNLGQAGLNSNNSLAAQQLQSQNANNLLQNQLGFQTNQNNSTLGQNNLNSQLSQFNTGQQNSLAQQYMAMLQSANQQQIQNQFTGYQNIASLVAGLAGAGIPGGSANVNLGGQSQSNAQAASSLVPLLAGLL